MSREVKENFTDKRLQARNYKIMRQFIGKSPADVKKETGISKQNLSTWENGQGNPGPEFIDTLSKYFGLPKELFLKEDLTIEYLKEMYPSANHTHDQNRDDNSEKAITALKDKELFQKVIRVGTTEYVVLPKTVLDGEYRISSTRDSDNYSKFVQQVIEAKEELIRTRDKRIEESEQKIREKDERILSLEKQLSEARKTVK